LITLLGRDFFVSPSDENEKRILCQVVFTIRQHSSAICPKVWTRKYQDHLASDGVSSHVLDRKTNTTWQRFVFSFLSGREIQTNLCQAG